MAQKECMMGLAVKNSKPIYLLALYIIKDYDT